MSRSRRRDINGLHLRIVSQLRVAAILIWNTKFLSKCPGSFPAARSYCNEFSIGNTGQVGCEKLGNCSGSQDPPSNLRSNHWIRQKVPTHGVDLTCRSYLRKSGPKS